MSDKRPRRDGPLDAIHFLFLAGALLVPAATLLATPGINPPAELTVGFHLQTFTSVRLTEQAPEGGLQVTITSDDPSRLLFAGGPDQPGSKSITLKVNSLYVETPDFYLEGLADSGTATYTITAPTLGTTKGTVKFGPSAVLIAGPSNSPSFPTTTGRPGQITAYTALLDSGKVLRQPVAGGLAVNVNITSSDPKVGFVTPSALTLAGGDSSVNTTFNPVGVGSTALKVNIPTGFAPPPTPTGTVKVTVDLPTIVVAGEITLGKDLQFDGSLVVTEPAPERGLDVTLISEDPRKLILSNSADQTGSGSIVLHVPAGAMRTTYYLQGLADTGTVSYTASAPGYRNRVAPVTLAPSGVLLGYSGYGFGSRSFDFPPFTVLLSDHKPIHLALWTAFLSPNTLRGEDRNSQRLRPGVSVTVNLKSSNPTVATVISPVTLTSALENFQTEFTPLGVGQVTISLVTPSGFTTPSNATSVIAQVKE